MDQLLQKITTKLCVTEVEISNLYMSGFRIPELDAILSRVHSDATFDEKFPFYALFRFMTLLQCEMFLRALVIHFFRHEQKVMPYKQPLDDKQSMYKILEEWCHDDKTSVMFVKTVSAFL